MSDKFERYTAAQSWFMKNSEIYTSPRSRALEIISQKVLEVMGIDRFGVWMIGPKGDSIIEEITISSDGTVAKDNIFERNSYPVYFEKLDSERVISINNAETEVELKSVVNDFLNPFNITAMLDAPIFSDGVRIGVACSEALHPREWDHFDKNFAATCADFIGRIIESEKRHNYEKELKHKIVYLEGDVHKKLIDLKEAKLSLDLALEGAQAGKWDWNIKTGELSLNQTWFTRLGYEYNEIPQNLASFKKVLHPDDVAKTFEALDRNLKGETAFYECRYRMITKSGEIQWCIDRGCVTKRASDGTPLFATGVNVNITPIIQLEQSLISSEKQLKAMIRSLPTPVAMFDRKFKYLAYSARWEEEWSKFGDIKIGEGIANRTSGNRAEWMDNMDRALEGEMISREEEMVEVTPEDKLWIKWVIQPWKLANGEIGGVVVMAENVTARVEAEMKIAQTSKLSALGEMAGGIAHEINNPLSIIKGYIDLLKRHSSRATLTEVLILQYIDKMDTTVERISRIVSGMRRFSRESSMDEKVPYPLNKIIDETLDICLERINNNGIALKVEYFTGEPMIACRSVEISQVLLNLINNSFQAILSLPHPWIRIECKELFDFYEIRISDCGKGIPDSVQKKLFQPFFTTKDIGVGTGLGLSISRGIIEEHEGLLDYVDGAPHTTFTIKLPILDMEDN
jgi:signal transduction histidine kinase